ncbi:putative SH3 domain protein [Taphrina deformans PYCC 5710]|uniref:SH3 domain protein n=1 Tax=Taphrina deformans (strain PYCC 5710 / ATCC 11124 / CBS 356.35 / IMI 108563 / JCM 9778 / NBRC 8474) TaxID=1097556 RepID=R4XBA7_TAPDE|nr:putative SH3 domain protein [Taphrina deformans PYCC 5710]|eukprot:CCG81636.1 putative SH3 domain protein [Taphrina deformans PYCC 5710]
MADVETSQVYCDNDDDTVSDLSSSPSIPDGEIDFNFVYALHTFLATVEGQATSQKGDTLVLLDDSNSYWWLVKNIKDESIGIGLTRKNGKHLLTGIQAIFPPSTSKLLPRDWHA